MRRATLVAAVCCLGLVTACSSAPAPSPSSPSLSADDAATFLAQAKLNARDATSVRLKGVGECPNGGFVADMSLKKSGEGAGTVTFGPDVVNVVATKDDLYLRAPEGFWATQASDAAAKRIGSKWVKVAKNSNPCLAALSTFSLALDNYLGYTGTATPLKGDSFVGQPAVQIGLDENVSYWVASRGVPLPLNVHDAETGTEMLLADWNADTTVAVPQASLVVDGRSLAG